LVVVGIASPLKDIAAAAERFGRGDLTARANIDRQDEIGDLARTFNAMADRTAQLLVAEQRLLQDVSHELRSPLARAAFAAELARTAPDRDAAVNHLLGGQKYVSPSLAEQLALGLHPDRGERPHERLSDREYQVLRMLARGKTVSQIAADLSLSVKTVSTYRARVLDKLNMKTTAELMRYGIENRLLNG
jgi:DNA-binding CsgD family transcriptional regulator